MDTKVEQFLQEQFHQFSQIDVRELVFSSELHKYCERKPAENTIPTGCARPESAT